MWRIFTAASALLSSSFLSVFIWLSSTDWDWTWLLRASSSCVISQIHTNIIISSLTTIHIHLGSAYLQESCAVWASCRAVGHLWRFWPLQSKHANDLTAAVTGHNTSQRLLRSYSGYIQPASLVRCVMLTNQCADQSVFFAKLCLEEDVVFAELLHLLFEQRQLLRLQPVHLRTFSLTLVLLAWNYGIMAILYVTWGRAQPNQEMFWFFLKTTLVTTLCRKQERAI